MHFSPFAFISGTKEIHRKKFKENVKVSIASVARIKRKRIWKKKKF